MSAAAPTHAALVQLGVRWLKRQGFSVVAAELTAAGCAEQPDVVGFRSTCSAIIEVKTSRADFLVDRSKPHRANTSLGMGLYRFFLALPGVMSPHELPARWGLLLTQGRSVTDVLRPKGNIWPGPGSSFTDWEAFQHPYNQEAERHALFSIARRAMAKPIAKASRSTNHL